MFEHMKVTIFFVFFLSSLGTGAQSLLKYVNPEIGTAHSRWFFYTPAAVPEGMAKLAPSTNGHYGNPSGWEAVGYDTRHNSIEGFVHFHEWQIGGVSFMPTTGPLILTPGELDRPHSGYRSAFDRKNQVAEPGYYRVLLDDYGITAELTATQRVGFHRYTFPANAHSHILLDIGNVQGESGAVTDAEVRMTDGRHFEGFVHTYPKYVHLYDPGGKVAMYFYGELSKEPDSVGTFTGVAGRVDRGKGAGLYLNYTTSAGEAIEIKVGLSYTSTANARANLLTEAAGVSFDAAKQKAQMLWEKELGRIAVEGDDTSKIKFYTGLFHALLGRGVASDVNGDYPKHGGGVGRMAGAKGAAAAAGKGIAAGRNFINTDAIWGAFWNLTQLWSLSYPDYYKDYVHTQLQIYKDKGWFGDGIANSEYVSGVGTNLVGLAIAAAYQAGIRDYDVDMAYRAVRDNELGWKGRKTGSGKMDTKAFLEHGYSPFLEEDKTDSTGAHFSASHTLEYSFSAFAAAQMARSLNKKQDYEQLIQLSNGWRHLYNPANRLLQPKRADGSFIDKFDPYAPWRGYQEGNAMQYTFYVPQNPKALIDTLGKDHFNTSLDKIFAQSQRDGFGGGKTINAFAGITSIYNHGNEPSLHISWLFNFSGKPWLTQKWTRAICDEFYGIEPIHGYGYGQDEDQGQLGAWYVLTALGLFDVKGCTDARPIVELGSPLFRRATIRLGNGRQLLIETTNGGKDHVYVQGVTFNGKRLDNCWIYRNELMRGGRLVFVMGDKPNEQWGSAVPPPSAQ
jgi:predicted alpha-1,2-mannosidase